MLFPPLPPGVRAAELVVPFVVVEETADPAELGVPTAGRAVGERIPLGRELPLGRYRLRVDAAELVDESGGRRLAVYFGASGAVDGRRLLGPGFVGVDGRDAGMNSWVQDEGAGVRITRISVPVGADPGPEVRLVLRGATVAVDGPWRLPVQLPARP
jgi:hypothetical protein